MVRAHRQAWAWQDEWHGLSINDIRDLEAQTQSALAAKMENADLEDGNNTPSVCAAMSCSTDRMMSPLSLVL